MLKLPSAYFFSCFSNSVDCRGGSQKVELRLSRKKKNQILQTGDQRKTAQKVGRFQGLKKHTRRKSPDPLICMRYKRNYQTTFCRKPELQKCPQRRVMANLAKTLKSAIL